MCNFLWVVSSDKLVGDCAGGLSASVRRGVRLKHVTEKHTWRNPRHAEEILSFMFLFQLSLLWCGTSKAKLFLSDKSSSGNTLLVFYYLLLSIPASSCSFILGSMLLRSFSSCVAEHLHITSPWGWRTRPEQVTACEELMHPVASQLVCAFASRY